MRAQASEARGGVRSQAAGIFVADLIFFFLALPAQNETRAGQGGDDGTANRILGGEGVARTSDLRALAALGEVPCTLPADRGGLEAAHMR